jgi:glycosyltransferase involved in cell wall biosynthesis
MPVYNGEKFIEQALESILGQTFEDWELIISDNASTDRTQAICEGYAARDPRIRYYRNENNLGAAPNFNRCFELAQGEYFKWAAHDDILAPDYLERCVAVLDQDPEIVLCYARARIIDENGEVIQDYDVHLRTDSSRPQDRLHDLLWVQHRYYQVFGVMRADVLRKTPLIEPYSASDRVLLVGMSQFGKFHEISDYLFFPRKHDHVSVRTHQTRHTRMVWFDANNQRKIVLPAWALFFGYAQSICRAPLSWRERLYGYRQMGRWMWHYRGTLWEDLMIAGKRKWLKTFRPGKLAPLGPDQT